MGVGVEDESIKAIRLVIDWGIRKTSAQVEVFRGNSVDVVEGV